MKQEELQKLQNELDVNKWHDAQTTGSDPCGTYDYCTKCDKNIEYPCATAKKTFDKPVKAKSDKAVRVCKNTTRKKTNIEK